MSRFKIALVGYGLIGQRRAQALRALEHRYEVELTAVIDPAFSSHTRPELAGDAILLSDAAELRSIGLDAAVVAVPHSATLEAVNSVVEAGARAVLVEKPLGLDMMQASQCALTMEGTPLPSFVGFNYRHLPNVERVLAAIRQERLGTLRSVNLVVAHGGQPADRNSWKLNPTMAGSGVMSDPGVHLFDLALLANPEFSIAASFTTSGFWGTGMPEDGVCILEHDRAIASLRPSTIRWSNFFEFTAVGEDAYASAIGRGGHYGPLAFRFGKRWGWLDAASQQESEEQLEFGTADVSFAIETERVVREWLCMPTDDDAAPLASPSDALRAMGLAEAAAKMGVHAS